MLDSQNLTYLFINFRFLIFRELIFFYLNNKFRVLERFILKE